MTDTVSARNFIRARFRLYNCGIINDAITHRRLDIRVVYAHIYTHTHRCYTNLTDPPPPSFIAASVRCERVMSPRTLRHSSTNRAILKVLIRPTLLVTYLFRHLCWPRVRVGHFSCIRTKKSVCGRARTVVGTRSYPSRRQRERHSGGRATTAGNEKVVVAAFVPRMNIIFPNLSWKSVREHNAPLSGLSSFREEKNAQNHGDDMSVFIFTTPSSVYMYSTRISIPYPKPATQENNAEPLVAHRAR